LIQVLLDRGARIHPGSIKSCMANGQPKAAEFLAARGAPIDMEEAAGLGRLDLVKTYLGAPASVSQEQMAASLRWAVYRLNVELVDLLLQHGAPVNGALDVAQYVLGKSQDDLERERCHEVIRTLTGGRPR
jgi:ankyrin repeat protein